MSKQFEAALDNFMAGCDVDTTMTDCAEFMFKAGVEHGKSIAEPVALTDEQIEKIAEFTIRSMPDGIRGFCRTWGYMHFAKQLLEVCAGHYKDTEKV